MPYVSAFDRKKHLRLMNLQRTGGQVAIANDTEAIHQICRELVYVL